mmetsp:Transcript_52625/g.79862  ORF Transcript_52625/g.79862 Transcript_52625/m.79862 type:complete len:315 (-) Transcript_52625:86-1030(-)
MVEQSTVRTVVLGVVVFVALHTLVSSFATKSTASSKSKEGDGKVADEDSENLKPWLDRWDSNRIGFHLDDVNPWLVKHIDKLLSKKDTTCSNTDTTTTTTTPTSTTTTTRVFVPLCGKTVDMAYLVQQLLAADSDDGSAPQVVGVDGIRKALSEFVDEQPDLKISKTTTTTADGYETFSGPNITLLRGDFFALTEAAAGGKFDAMFDRGSLVAIDPKMRQAYLDIIGKLMAPGGKILLVSVERRGTDLEAVKKGPPFSISEGDVREMYEGLDWVESVTLLDAKDEFEDDPKARERSNFQGLDQLMQLTFLIQAK